MNHNTTYIFFLKVQWFRNYVKLLHFYRCKMLHIICQGEMIINNFIINIWWESCFIVLIFKNTNSSYNGMSYIVHNLYTTKHHFIFHHGLSMHMTLSLVIYWTQCVHDFIIVSWLVRHSMVIMFSITIFFVKDWHCFCFCDFQLYLITRM